MINNSTPSPLFWTCMLQLFVQKESICSNSFWALPIWPMSLDGRALPGVSGNSRSHPFPKMKASDSCSRIMGMDFVIPFPFTKGLDSQCKAQEKCKERLDLGVTWLKWLPTGMESKTRLAPKSNKVNSHKLTLNWNTSLYYRVVWKWRQSAFHANNHAIGGGSNGIIIHLCLNPGFGLQLLSINFVGFGSQHGLRFHTSRQSFEPSYTQIQALLVFLWAYVAKLYPRRIGWTSLGGC